MFKIYITEQLKLIDELGLLIVSSDRLRNDDTLHDFRVALRRFLSIFNIIIKNTEPDPMLIEHLTVLKQIRKETNRLRDLEVLSDILKGKKIDGEFGSKGENELLSYINKLAEKELENILATMKNSNFQEATKFINLFLENYQSKIDFDSYIQKYYKNIKKSLKVELNDERIHYIRVNLKKIRYLFEMKNKDISLIDELKEVQEIIGHYNDLRNGIDILQNMQIKGNFSRQICYAIGYYIGLFISEKVYLREKLCHKIESSLKKIKNLRD